MIIPLTRSHSIHFVTEMKPFLAHAVLGASNFEIVAASLRDLNHCIIA